MKRLPAILASALFVAMVPGTVVGLVPFWLARWRLGEPLFGLRATPGAGLP